jgi:hypothetical protein
MKPVTTGPARGEAYDVLSGIAPSRRGQGPTRAVRELLAQLE